MSLLWNAIILVFASGAAVFVMLVVRRRAPEGSHIAQGDRASGVFGVLATGFAILLGLVVVLAFTSYDDTLVGAETEALVLTQQAETAAFMPPEIRARLSDELVCYGRTVVHQQWPALEHGTLSEAFNPWSVAMFRTLRTTKATTPEEQSAYDKWIDQTSDREVATNDRIHGAEGVIPIQLWVVLFLIAAIIIIFILFFADSGEHAVVQALLIGSVVAVFTASLLLIGSLDAPYKTGRGGLEPVAIERALRNIERHRNVVGLEGARLPCDASGRPLSS